MDDFKPFLKPFHDRNRINSENRYLCRTLINPYKPSNLRSEKIIIIYHFRTEPKENNFLSLSIIAKKFIMTERKFSKSDDFSDRDIQPRDEYFPEKKNFELIQYE